jgi:hypothetical protein
MPRADWVGILCLIGIFVLIVLVLGDVHFD